MKLTIPGTPIGKARPRVTRTHTYTPQKTKDYEKLIAWTFKAKYPHHKPFTKAVKMSIIAYFPIPKSTSKSMRELMLTGQILHTKKPDGDNVIKSITDSMNGLAYKDDSQIAILRIDKFYSDNPRVEIEMEEIK